MDKYTHIKGLNEEDQSGNGSKLALYQWRGEVTQAIKNMEDQMKLLRDDVSKQICDVRSDIRMLDGKVGEKVSKTLEEVNMLKLEAAREGAKNGQKWAILIGMVTIFISFVKDWILRLFVSQ